jgi:bacteriocin biosynthesis cyclodehydratase domain-containing protein
MHETRRSVLTWGDFGRSIAIELSSWKPVPMDEVEDRTRLNQRIEATVSESSEVVFATWREHQGISRMLDGCCNAAEIPWIAVVAEHPWVRVGPGIAPGRTPCYKCFSLRRLQHDRNAELSLALQTAYVEDPCKGVRGYLPHHITIAAGLIAWVDDKLRNSDDRRSPVAFYHTLSHEIVFDYVVGIHGCNICDSMSGVRTNEAILGCIEPLAKRRKRPIAPETEAKLA